MKVGEKMIDAVKLGQRIRTLRKNNRLTISQLAERVGISDNFMGNIERATDTPSLETLVKVANTLCVPLDELLYDSLVFHVDYSKRNNDALSHEINKKVSVMSSYQKKTVLQSIELLESFSKKVVS